MSSSIYNQDGLNSIHSHEFMQDPAFIKAYKRGVQAAGIDYNWHWRVHIGLWAARTAAKLPGDFVECGVNAGFMSSSIMFDLKWDGLNKMFYLLDTFKGLEPSQASSEEIEDGIIQKNNTLIESGFYVASSDKVRRNFAEWQNIKIIEGTIPETLNQINAEAISFLHIDLNCALPEIASIKYLWDRLINGAIILLDDYAYNGYVHQKHKMDQFAEEKGIAIASLPTGQGIIIKN